jgi:hypothetical protein
MLLDGNLFVADGHPEKAYEQALTYFSGYLHVRIA